MEQDSSITLTNFNLLNLEKHFQIFQDKDHLLKKPPYRTESMIVIGNQALSWAPERHTSNWKISPKLSSFSDTKGIRYNKDNHTYEACAEGRRIRPTSSTPEICVRAKNNDSFGVLDLSRVLLPDGSFIHYSHPQHPTASVCFQLPDEKRVPKINLPTFEVPYSSTRVEVTPELEGNFKDLNLRKTVENASEVPSSKSDIGSTEKQSATHADENKIKKSVEVYEQLSDLGKSPQPFGGVGFENVRGVDCSTDVIVDCKYNGGNQKYQKSAQKVQDRKTGGGSKPRPNSGISNTLRRKVEHARKYQFKDNPPDRDWEIMKKWFCVSEHDAAAVRMC